MFIAPWRLPILITCISFRFRGIITHTLKIPEIKAETFKA